MSDRLSRSPSASVRRSKRKSSTKHRPSLSSVPEEMGDTRADEADALLSVQSRHPGRNAWAEQTLRHNRYMLGTNAFVQQEFSRRENTPPSMIHPALRSSFNLFDTTQPLPTLDPEEVRRHMATHPRDSDVTTMSPFLAAGLEESPVLDLGTTPEHTPQPTQRAFIEDRRESHDHKQKGSEEERVPVYKHTPKAAAEEFATPQTASSKKTDDIKAQQQTPVAKSPKKGFFSRLGWSARGKTATPQPPSDGAVESPDGTQMSVKARAMLVDPPPIRGLMRSPSKPKGLFSRRTSDAAEITSATKRPDPPRAATSLGHRTPQNITWQLPRSTSKKKLDAARKANDERTLRNTQANTTLGRSRSLKQQDDGKAPPTPPAKDTPPEVVAQRRLAAQQSQLAQSFSNDTPTRTPQVVTPSISITPTSRQASFGHRGQGTLVTQASMYSMRASVVADAMDPSAFNDAKSRINALGIEGFSMPDECNQRRSVIEYSPSAYSPDENRRSVLRFPERAGSRIEKKLQLQTSMNTIREPAHNAQDSHSTTGTIPVVYPELAKDPSIASFMEYDSSILMPPDPEEPESPSPKPGEFDRAYVDVQNMVKDETFDSPVSLQSEAPTEGLFAISLKRTPQRLEQSPMINHPSAMPSPLRNTSGEAYLPSSTFQPPVPWLKEGKTPQRLRLQRVSEEQKISDGLPSPDELPWTPGGRPRPKPSIFDNRPHLTRPKDLVVRQSPPMGVARGVAKGDPEKSPRARSPSPRSSSLPKSQSKDSDQLQQLSDRVLSMAQDYETKIEELNDSARAENARLHQRLASIEIATAIPKPEICYGDEVVPGSSGSSSSSRRTSAAEKNRHVSAAEKKTKNSKMSSPGKRISTGSIAQDFYRNSEDSPVDSVATTEKSTIILTPNLPRNVTIPRADSPTVPASSPIDAAPPSVGSAKDSDSGVDRLYAIVERQQQMMLSMMEEIRDLKRQGGGGGAS